MTTQVDFQLVRTSCLGDELTNQEAQVLAGVMDIRQLDDKEVLVGEGQADTTLFLLAEGRLEVINPAENSDDVVYTMRKGECAGTRAFVDRSPRKATLRAAGKATIYMLEPERFESLLESHPLIVYKIMRALFRITHSNLMRMNLESAQLAKYIHRTGGRY